MEQTKKGAVRLQDASHLTKKHIFWLLFGICLTEIAMGGMFYPIVLLQQYNSIWVEVIQKLFYLLHMAAIGLVSVFGLMWGKKTAVSQGAALLGYFLGAIFIKDLVGNTISFYHEISLTSYAGGMYTFGDIFGMALATTAINILITGASLFLLFFLCWGLFIKPSPFPTAPGLFDWGHDRISLSALIILVAVTVVDLVMEILTILEVGEEAHWLLRSNEIISMILGMVFPIISAAISYLLVFWCRIWFGENVK